MSSAAGARSGCFCGALDMDDTEKRADPAVASMTEVADLDAPACGNVSADMSAFDDDEDMPPSSSSEISKPKRGRACRFPEILFPV